MPNRAYNPQSWEQITSRRYPSLTSAYGDAANVPERNIGTRQSLQTQESDSTRHASGFKSFLGQTLAKALLIAAGEPPIRIAVADGVPVSTRENAVTTVRVRDNATLLKLLAYPDLNFGDAYTDGSAEVEGDLVTLLELCARARPRAHSLNMMRRVAAFIDSGRRNSLAGSRANIHHHYDLGNAFYRLWLDKEMAYTCAYFPRKEATLEEAQIGKLDHICKKLRLRRGDRVFEAGCGWGAFALHAATHYGASVKAFNISKEQISFARARAQALGVQDRVEFIEDDYRNVAGVCDAFVSIGMLEHVGRENYGDLRTVIDRCLAPSGCGLIHSIGQDRPLPLNPWIERRIFPGAYPPALSEMMNIFEPARLSVLDVENLRPHYALTIEHWLSRFEANLDQIRGMYGESFVRAWRFYLAGSIAAFRTGELQLFQVLFNRTGMDNAAWTRDHLYCNAE